MNTLRHGDRSADVGILQLRLARAGMDVTRTGIYDDATEAAVRRYQSSHGLVADGIAGPQTNNALVGAKSPGSLTQADIERAAGNLACDTGAVLAVLEVETNGSGFLADGRAKILFERHIMYRQLKAAGIDPDPWVAKYPNIVNPDPGGYQGGISEYVRLATAKTIDAACAIASASWGLFQIMGEHWSALGFGTVQAFADAMQSGESAQLDAFVGFVAGDEPLHKALKAHDWPEFARRYNGPGYERNLYDVKLERAYARHAAAMAPPADQAPQPKRGRKSAKAAAG